MRSLQFNVVPRQIFRSDFATEWLAVAVVISITVIWAWSIHFRLVVQSHDVVPLCGIVLLVLVSHAIKSERASLVTEYFLLTAIATSSIGVISYLSMATDRPLADDAFMAADRSIGFDWLASYHWVLHHALATKVLQIAYGSLVYQGMFFGVLFGILSRRQELREMFWLVLVAGLLTCAGAAFFPALGPFKTFGVKAEFLPVMEQLRDGRLHYALSELTGVVSFPSFHTTMALLFLYGFRSAGRVGWVTAALNVAMLPAIPFFGGHYMVDMLGGGAVALLSLLVVKAWPGLMSAAALSPTCAAVGLYDRSLDVLPSRSVATGRMDISLNAGNSRAPGLSS